MWKMQIEKMINLALDRDNILKQIEEIKRDAIELGVENYKDIPLKDLLVEIRVLKMVKEKRER